MASDAPDSDWLRPVNVLMDLGQSLEEALLSVPADAREAVRELHSQQAVQEIRRVRGVTLGGPKEWFADWDPSSGYYWPRQRKYLLDQVGRSPKAVEATDDDSDRVLQYLPDPRPLGPESFDCRGLVIGHVQSGKTENFSALIAKAADVGYQIIIVLSGVHNGLRQQTQRRLERELGLEDLNPGVGWPDAGKRFVNPTTADLFGDFDSTYVDSAILQGNERVVFVCKKWHTVLGELVDFVSGSVPAHVPVLVIDDEADQASVNTGGNRQPVEELVDAEPDVDLIEELNPSTTNGLIRDLLSKFSRVSYVAYTATPFANVLIPHEAKDREVYEDLFPRDFILTLFPRPGYVGAARLFGHEAIDEASDDEVDGLDVVRFVGIPDLPAVSPKAAEVKVADFVPSVPLTMELAIRDWLLATGGLLARAGKDQPSCMLIHIHQVTHIQNNLAPQVSDVMRELRNNWRYDKKGPIRKMLRKRWEDEFRPVTRRIDAERDMSFEDIEDHIDRVLKDGVPVLALNSKTRDALDYDIDPNLKAILIGGNRLSRGMTLEGLCVSYYVRETPYMDTLLQMGRWFGYREAYVDLTRLWTTQRLSSWFRDIALREEELRMQIMQAERDRLPPVEAGYRIRTHKAMMVTSQAKMGAGRPTRISYERTMLQTSRLRINDKAWLANNLKFAQSFCEQLGAPGKDDSGTMMWSGVSWELICEFLSRYRTVQDRTTFDADAAASYIRAQVAHHELETWKVAVASQEKTVEGLGTIDLHIEGFDQVNAINRSRLSLDHTSIGVLTSAAKAAGPPYQGDEEIGLAPQQIQAARQRFADKKFERLRDALLDARSPDEGLLVLYPISRFSKPGANAKNRIDLFDSPEVDGEDVIGAAIAFPSSSSAATIEYVAQNNLDSDDE